jgi:glycosyltransferase involved in cell wall biosynthesis
MNNNDNKSELERVLTVSVIMPVYNGIEFIQKSLPPLIEMKEHGEVLEVIVVDDSSSDDTPEVSRKLGATVIPSGGRLGPGGARNIAANKAKGDILWFIDADVIVHENAAKIMMTGFDNDEVVAVFGSYDDDPPAQNFLSQYKNLVHHYYHQRAKKDASTFWSGCGAVKKDAFLKQGGFDIEMFKRPSIEDIELGYRLINAGGKLVLLTDMQCTHLKVWHFVNLIHTEVICRAIPWAKLMLNRGGLDNDLNIGMGERVKAVFAALLALMLLLAFAGFLSWFYITLMVMVVITANWQIAKLFYQRKGIVFATGALLFHQFYYLYSSTAFAWVVLEKKLGLNIS